MPTTLSFGEPSQHDHILSLVPPEVMHALFDANSKLVEAIHASRAAHEVTEANANARVFDLKRWRAALDHETEMTMSLAHAYQNIACRKHDLAVAIDKVIGENY